MKKKTMKKDKATTTVKKDEININDSDLLNFKIIQEKDKNIQLLLENNACKQSNLSKDIKILEQKKQLLDKDIEILNIKMSQLIHDKESLLTKKTILVKDYKEYLLNLNSKYSINFDEYRMDINTKKLIKKI